ncbi:hypothetical protein GWK91_15170 [Virgibacillus sp. MSP4-1]|uniref:hypothetical protein n=1 Tax=Virgibacillus sp. MSP4-1 TaxID=2700081 RepID=UPI00069341F1|nr:hypothetical protein [Virgibacillus sp. MSP4-1]QHS24158.1 hypothetical protein GWK91_15170 [Virgibacillus sp. MSP4-1]
MKRYRVQRSMAIIIIGFITFWNLFPIVSYASFITPGTPITPGETITPGEPIEGGEYIIPGEVLPYGDPIQEGEFKNSGEPIIEGEPINEGLFMIPNVPEFPAYQPIGGDAVSPGSPIQSGSSPQSGNGLEGGNATSPGSPINGGNAGAGGSATEGGNLNTGDTLNGGSAINGGNQSGAGEAPASGNPVNGGDASQGGHAVDGNAINGGDGPSSGSDGHGSAGNAGEGDIEPKSFLNIALQSTDGSQGLYGHITGFFKDVKNYGLKFADDLAQGAASIYAGFQFRQLENGNYSVKGKNKLNNRLSNWFYDRYRQYTFNGESKEMGPKVRYIRQDRMNAFLSSKSIPNAGTMSGLLKNSAQSAKSAVNQSWNVFSKGFWKPSSSVKLGGPAGIILNSAGSIYDHSNGFSDLGGLATTDFAASFTTDAAIGVASTAAGSAASAMASGAVAGSVVPGVGTIIGAAAGLGVGIATSYFFNGTNVGGRIKKGITKGIKKGYDAIAGGVKKGVGAAKEAATWAKDKVSSAFSKLGGIFD